MIDNETLAKIKSGATVRVEEKIKEKDKERLSHFSGLVLARKHGKGNSATITIRSEVAGVGVEKIYPLFSPMINKIEIINSPKKVKRSKLYFLRDLSKKKIRQKLGSKDN